MEICFEQSGGFAGLRFQVTLDTEKLPAEEGEKLISLVEEADFFHLPEKIVSPRPQPDRYQYDLKVKSGSKEHAVTVSEEAVPPRLAPLITRLQQAARQKALSGR